MEDVLVMVGVGLLVYFLLQQQPATQAQPTATSVNAASQITASNPYGINTTVGVTQNGVQVYPQSGGGSSCVVGNVAYYSSTQTCPPKGIGK
jgi:hypothetical protein